MKDRVITSEEGEMIDTSYDKGFNDGYRKGLEKGKNLSFWFGEGKMTPEEFYLDQTGETVEQMEAHNDLHEPSEMVEFARMYGQKIACEFADWLWRKRSCNALGHKTTYYELFTKFMKEMGKLSETNSPDSET